MTAPANTKNFFNVIIFWSLTLVGVKHSLVPYVVPDFSLV